MDFLQLATVLVLFSFRADCQIVFTAMPDSTKMISTLTRTRPHVLTTKTTTATPITSNLTINDTISNVTHTKGGPRPIIYYDMTLFTTIMPHAVICFEFVGFQKPEDMLVFLSRFPDLVTTRQQKCFLRCLLRRAKVFKDPVGKKWDWKRSLAFLKNFGFKSSNQISFITSALFFCMRKKPRIMTKYGCKNAFNFFLCLRNHGMSFSFSEAVNEKFRKTFEKQHPIDRASEYDDISINWDLGDLFTLTPPPRIVFPEDVSETESPDQTLSTSFHTESDELNDNRTTMAGETSYETTVSGPQIPDADLPLAAETSEAPQTPIRSVNYEIKKDPTPVQARMLTKHPSGLRNLNRKKVTSPKKEHSRLRPKKRRKRPTTKSKSATHSAEI